MKTKHLTFTTDGLYYWPANKNAVGVCAIMSKMKLKDSDMRDLIIKGYKPRLTNGELIGKTDIKV